MKYPRILAALRSARWAVTPSTLQAIRDTLSARLTGRLADSMGADEGSDESAPPYEMLAPGVASVKLHGIIGRNLSSLEMMCGGCDLFHVEQCLTLTLADPAVASVILDVDSPGGTVGGVAEFSAKVTQLAALAGKPVFAFASGNCCSAAYWAICGCNGIACSPSSDVGSIGIYMALVDESENWASEGYKLVLIKSGEFKAAGMAGSKITDAQIKLWQHDVDFIYAQFAGAVRDARPAVKDEVMQGQVFYGPRALDAGLVDQVLPDIAAMAAAVSPVVPQMLAAPIGG